MLSIMKKYFAEFLGTMFLVLLACGSAVFAGPVIGGLGIGLCFGLVLVCLCYAIGGISGCHVNPAVSFAFWVSGKMKTGEFLAYVFSQLLGAAVGAGFLFWATNMDPGFNFGGTTPGGFALATNVPQPNVSTGMALLVEGLLTFFFVFVVLGATSKIGNASLAGVAIGLALGLVNIVGIPVDNCSVNPARSFGPALFNPAAFQYIWIMIVGPLAGALLAAVAWMGLIPASKESTVK